MIKSELISQIAKQTGVERAKVAVVVESLMDNVKKAMIEGDDVALRGFGTFTRKHRAEKSARNIRADKTVIVKAHDIPYFKPSMELKAEMSK